MAWLDDRAWCHPKLVDLSDKAFRVYVNGISYSSGMGLGGRLSAGQQKLLGSDTKVRGQLVAAGLWHVDGDTVEINGWDEHNGKRDERRRADRERKRLARMSAGTSAGQSAGASAGTARVEGSEGSEGSEVTKKQNLLSVSARGKPAVTEHPFVIAWRSHSPPLVNHHDGYFDDPALPRAAAKAERSFGAADVLAAIDAYAVNQATPERYFLNYRWGLIEFLSRGVKHFVPEARPNQPRDRDGRRESTDILALARAVHQQESSRTVYEITEVAS